MNLYYDLDLKRLVTVAGGTGALRRIDFKLRDQLSISLRFFASGLASSISGTDITFGLKATKAGDLLAAASTWTESSGVYSAVLDLNTQDLIDAVTADTLECVAELTCDDGGITSSQTVTAVVEKDVITGDEGAPTSLPTPEDWLDARAVRYDKVQTLDAGELAQARENTFAMEALAHTVTTVSPPVTLTTDDYGKRITTDATGTLTLPLAEPGRRILLRAGSGTTLSVAASGSNAMYDGRTGGAMPVSLTSDDGLLIYEAVTNEWLVHRTSTPASLGLDASGIRAILGIPEYANVSSANAALGGIGKLFYNTTSDDYETTTSAS